MEYFGPIGGETKFTFMKQWRLVELLDAILLLATSKNNQFDLHQFQPGNRTCEAAYSTLAILFQAGHFILDIARERTFFAKKKLFPEIWYFFPNGQKI